MMLIIDGLSERVREPDIQDFITPVLKGGLLSKSGTASNIKIVGLEDPETKARQYYATVILNLEPVAKRVIKKLNSKILMGHHVAIRQFHVRSWHNDPRESGNTINTDVLSQRKADRRHLKKIEHSTHINMKPTNAKFDGTPGFL